MASRSSEYKQLDMSDLSGKDRDAANALIDLFRGYGLESLAPRIIQYIRQGYGEDTIYLLLQDTPEWDTRFQGNGLRKKAGLPVLSPKEYLATENSYREIMHAAGLPSGFYDRPQDFANFFWKNVSPSELQARVQVVSDWVTNQDPSTREFMKKNYGIGSTGDLVAYAIDPNRALPLLQKQAKAIKIGGLAARAGFGVSKVWTEHLVDIGVTEEQAQQGYSRIAEALPTYEQLGNIYGEDYGQEEAEKEIFEGNAEATQKRKGLASQERAAFGGSSKGRVGSSSKSY